jgi:hypothetical protein
LANEVGKVWGAALVLSLSCGRGDATVITAPAEVARQSGVTRGSGGATAAAPAAVVTGTPTGGTSASASAAGTGGTAAGAPGRVAAAGAPGSTSTVGATGASVASAAGESFRHGLPGRLIAIGDLHGDIAATRAALRLGGAIDASDRWIGDTLTVVQTGDQLDRGDEEREILDLLRQLEASAQADGGQVIALNGNHEVMNVQGDFRYVTPGGIGAFAGVTPRSPLARSAPPAFVDRAAAFLPGGAYALELAERDVIAVVGDSVFVHGGLLPDHVRYGIDRINRETQAWMRGGERQAPVAIAAESAPIWVRDYSLDPVSPRACEMLGEVLLALKVSRMVVGHTVQSQGISSACDDRIYRIDVGLSRYYGQNPIQVLEIDAGKTRVLRAQR